jgi:hypothetical protein
MTPRNAISVALAVVGVCMLAAGTISAVAIRDHQPGLLYSLVIAGGAIFGAGIGYAIRWPILGGLLGIILSVPLLALILLSIVAFS